MQKTTFSLFAMLSLAACADGIDHTDTQEFAARAPVPRAAVKKKVTFATATKAERADAAELVSDQAPAAVLLISGLMRDAAADGKCGKYVTKDAIRTIDGPCKIDDDTTVEGQIVITNMKIDDDDDFVPDLKKEQRIAINKMKLTDEDKDVTEIDGTLSLQVIKGKEHDLDFAVKVTFTKALGKPENSAINLFLSCIPDVNADPQDDAPIMKCTTRKGKVSEASYRTLGWYEVRGTINLHDSLEKEIDKPGTLELIGADTMVLDLEDVSKIVNAGPGDDDDCFAATVDKKKIEPVCMSDATE